jgi:Protein of unknown function (DUF2786)
MTTPNKDDMLRKVRALLAKAEDPSATGPEADALTAKAAELMSKYGIDDAMASQRRSVRDKPGDKIFTVDNPYAAPKSSLLTVVARAFRCKAIQVSRGTGVKVHVFGFAADLEMVDILYTSLLLQASHGVARVASQTDYYGRSRTRSARSSYLLGFASAVQTRLAEVDKEAERASAPGTAVVLRSRAAEVQDAVSAVYPSVRQTVARVGNVGGYGQGHAAGMRANLHNRGAVGNRQAALR